jgi:coenzyme PQQ precursor peptide PqqA
MTLNKDVDPQRKFSCSARKARPKAGKTDPKVLLATPVKRLSFGVRHRCSRQQPMRRYAMQWIDPDFCDLRLGFEVTAYVYVR